MSLIDKRLPPPSRPLPPPLPRPLPFPIALVQLLRESTATMGILFVCTFWCYYFLINKRECVIPFNKKAQQYFVNVSFKQALYSYARSVLPFVGTAALAAGRRTKPRGSLGANLPQVFRGGRAGRSTAVVASGGRRWGVVNFVRMAPCATVGVKGAVDQSGVSAW